MYSLNFRQFCEEEDQLADLLRTFVMFFKRGEDFFGAPEESRIVFAKLKQPDAEDGAKWQDEARFLALNLLTNSQSVFGLPDLKNLQILDADKVSDLIRKKKKKNATIRKR